VIFVPVNSAKIIQIGYDVYNVSIASTINSLCSQRCRLFTVLYDIHHELTKA